MAALLCLVALVTGVRAEPARPLSEFAHSRWGVDQGAPADIWTLALSPAGALWLGTGLGLYRFDGVRFERYALREGERLASNNINALHLEPGGDIWLGLYAGGAVRLRDGHATSFGEAQGLPGGRVLRFARGPDGVLWAAAGDGLARFDGQRWHRVGAEANFQDVGADYVFTDRRGVLWVAGTQRLYWRAPGQAQFRDTGELISRGAVLAQDRAGRVWLAEGRRGTRPLPDYPRGAPVAAPIPALDSAPPMRAKQLLFAEDGSLWLTQSGVGVRRVRDASAVPTGQVLREADAPETFTRQEGLPANVVVPLVQGMDGEVWVGSNHGLSSFRLQQLQPLKAFDSGEPAGFTVAAAGEGVVALSGMRRATWSPPQAPVVSATDRHYRAAVGDATGTLWLVHADGVWRERAGQAERVWLYAERRNYGVQALAPDPRGGAWLAAPGAGVYHLGEHGARREPRLEPDGALPMAITVAPDGTAWFAYDDRLLRLQGEQLQAFGAADGLRVGRPTTLLGAAGGTVFVGGEAGFARFDGRHFVQLDNGRDGVFSHVTGAVLTPAGDLWLNGARGLVQVPAQELAALPASGTARPHYRLMDRRDGLPGIALQATPVPTLVLDRRQRLWAATNGGVAWLDATGITRSERAIGVDILGLRAGDRSHRPEPGLVLPAGSRSVVIRYSALTLAAADRARFRYRLEGVDTDWQDADSRREASYANLGPGDYRFRVVAANGDGVWSTQEASLPFSIAPLFWQTKGFLLAAGLAVLALLAGAYLLRTRALAAGVRRQIEARHGERERIARELHDTLLQSTQGLILNIQGVASGMPVADPARQRIEAFLDRADQVAVEARARVLDLRAPQADAAKLLAGLQALGAAQAPPQVAFSAVAVGEARPLDPAVADQLGCIGQEAVLNAFTHAQARRVEVVLACDATELRLRVQDDGVGMRPDWAAGGARPGHWGLPGMRERASQIGAKLSIIRPPSGGTLLEVAVPGRVAYVESA
jgi:signal transduction histidine kinase/ligand-binding sensor domain-containing protein